MEGFLGDVGYCVGGEVEGFEGEEACEGFGVEALETVGGEVEEGKGAEAFEWGKHVFQDVGEFVIAQVSGEIKIAKI